ncbi:MAG: ornithine carbamoyltransferase [Actinobacteria bacterium]|nr:ornithine carbamoyltransferase [Actinomycetota bacterium]
MAKRDFLSLADLSSDELTALLDAADNMKAKPTAGAKKLAGRSVVLIFEKPSTRTRVSFEVAVTSMGGHPVVLRGDELQLGRGETIADTGRVLSLYADVIAVRTFGQDRLDELAGSSSVPVVNLLSDFSHPCQGLADLQTIRAAVGSLEGVALCYLGDGNNVAHSLMFGGAKTGMDVRIATPRGYEPSPDVVARSQQMAAETGGKLSVTNVVAEAASGADVLYTDVWASMGKESEAEERLAVFEHYRLNDDALALANDDAIVMHCLPAHRGEEITAGVIDGDRSVVWDQAANRLHTQKALLAWLVD